MNVTGKKVLKRIKVKAMIGLLKIKHFEITWNHSLILAKATNFIIKASMNAFIPRCILIMLYKNTCVKYVKSITVVNQGVWSHTRVKFKKIPSKKICCYKKSEDQKAAVITLTTIRMNNLGNNTAKECDLIGERQKANTLYISKLIRVVHFLARNNLPVKSQYPKMINFLSYELEEPIIKQYLDNCPSNTSYTSHKKLVIAL